MADQLRDQKGRYVPATRKHGLFQLGRPSWPHAKSACYVYETQEEGVDTGIVIEGEGVLFLSTVAIREMAEVAGLTMVDGATALEAELAYAQHDAAAWRERYETLAEGLTEARKYLT